MANYYDFSSSNVNILMVLMDKSNSMEPDEDNVRKCAKGFVKSFSNFSEKGSIAASICQFSDSFYPDDFKRIDNLKINYSIDGGTAIYYSIVKGAEHLNNYVKEVIRRTKCNPKVTFLLLSDGEPCHDKMSIGDAKEAIKKLNIAKVNTIFIPFRDAISSEFGKRLGFKVTRKVDNSDELINFFKEDLPASVKLQSKSYKPLGANFFSKAVGANSTSKEYSHTTEQVLEDNSWIEDL